MRLPGKIADRLVLSELLGPFGFGVAAFTAILTASSVLFNLITLMVRFGLPFSVVGEVMALKLPEMAFYTFPMSMLLASMLAFGRLSGDSEVTALRACGVSLYRILMPVVGFAIFVSGATIALNEFVVPQADWQAKNILYQAQHHKQLPTDRDNVFYDEMQNGALKRFFYARHFDGTQMDDALVQEFDGDHLDRIIQARDAVWQDGAWHFQHGIIYQLAADGSFRYVMRFEDQVVPLRYSLLQLTKEDRSPTEMNIRELAGHISQLSATGHSTQEINELLVQLYQKLAVPFASLVFVLVGAPLGLKPHRSSGSLGLGLSVLILFVYYVFMFLFMAMGQSGTLDPMLAAWLPDLLTGGIGAFLIVKAARFAY